MIATYQKQCQARVDSKLDERSRPPVPNSS